MMKKLILAALLAALSLTVAACGTDDDTPSGTEADTTAATVETGDVADSVTAEETAEETIPEAETTPETESEPAPDTETTPETTPETQPAPETKPEPETKPAPAGPTWEAGENVALNKYVQASGSAWDGDMWGIQMVTDGSIMQTEFEAGGTNGWMSNAVSDVTGETWISIDLGYEFPINKIVLYPRQSGERFPTGFYIEVSTDGSNWTKVVEETADPYTLEGRTFEFDSIEAAYVRLTITEMHADSYVESFGGYIAQLSEIEVYTSQASN